MQFFFLKLKKEKKMDQITKVLEKNVEKVYPSKKALEKVLRSDKKLRLYIGIDPTATRLHLGHTIGIRKLQEFADLGHEAIFLFGDGTVLVGDPSERTESRKLITEKEIAENTRTWKKQIKPFLNLKKVKEKHNANWLTKLTLKDLIKIGSKISAVQLFKRDNFQERLKRGDTVFFHETMYPLLQGYDSVHMDIDLEIGGTDQTFNMLMGRELQKKFRNKEKFVLTTKMILGADGQKMSKTSKNCIWLTDKPKNMYGKIMRLKDELIPSYFEAFTDMDPDKTKKIKQSLLKKQIDPMKTKKELAFKITAQVHGEKKAGEAEQSFEKVVQQGKTPDKIPTFPLNKGNKKENIINLLTKTKLANSRSEAKRLIKQKAVEINSKKIEQPVSITLKKGDIIKAGKRKWIKIR
jgi:tyrosyl-tRNA synthetase